MRGHTFSVTHKDKTYHIQFIYWDAGTVYKGEATQAIVIFDATTEYYGIYSSMVSRYHKDKPNLEIGRRKVLELVLEGGDEFHPDKELRTAIWKVYLAASPGWRTHDPEDIKKLLENVKRDLLEMASSIQEGK